MASGLSDSQVRALQFTERAASVVSLVGCAWIFITFVSSPRFRKPVGRLIFYASLGNVLCNVATLISQDGIKAGGDSALCQFQAFLIQMFLPADALWNLCMAINVYLTVFKKYNAAQLRKMEWRYLVACYGLTFIPAFAYCFIWNAQRGRVYGPALTWCSISIGWNFLRIALCYGPAWVCIIIIFTIYVLAGRDIFKKRQQLRAFNTPAAAEFAPIENPFISFKTTEIQISSEPIPRTQSRLGQAHGYYDVHAEESDASRPSFEPYSVIIERGFNRPLSPAAQSVRRRQNNMAMEANSAALGYLKCAILFFVSLLITWVPSSTNRVYSLIYPNELSFSFNYMGGLVLPLMGFWNAVIYTTTSWPAVKYLFSDLSWPGLGRLKGMTGARIRIIGPGVEMGRPRSLSSGKGDSLPVEGRRGSDRESSRSPAFRVDGGVWVS